ncbi:tRNA-modifying protein YgfZ [Methylophilaceae bacterium]|nr:tRNA-modifying protein YgfZ [Methylophilaceae bacterium]
MTQWQTYLNSLKAEIADGQVLHFGNPEAELQAAATGNVLADLSHLGLLQVEGDDRIAFLQGQVTNDIKLLDGSNSHYTGQCNPKGRMLALFLAFAHHDYIHLQLNRQLLEPIMKRLKMYVLRSKVAITDVSDSIVRMGFAGAQAEGILQGVFTRVPQQDYALASLDKAVLIRLPGSTPRYEILAQPEYAEEIWSALDAHASLVGKPCWDWLEIQAGIPDIAPATQEAFVPQMINLDALGGINFKKGCYTGQEIVARTHYLGKVKRRTHLAHIDGNSQPAAGDEVQDTAGIAGQIVRSAPHPAGGYDVLAELRLESVEAGPLSWHETPLVIQPLPYSLERQK